MGEKGRRVLASAAHILKNGEGANAERQRTENKEPAQWNGIVIS